MFSALGSSNDTQKIDISKENLEKVGRVYPRMIKYNLYVKQGVK